MRPPWSSSGPLAVTALAAAALMAGCGSSGSSGSSASSAATRTAAVAPAPSGGTTSPGSSLKVSGTPRYASPPASEPVRSGTVQIDYRNVTISPDTLRVKAGTTVRWTNFDRLEYNVTSQSGPQHFASRNFGEGGMFTVRLTRPGTIHYLCTNHPATMNGTIEVLR